MLQPIILYSVTILHLFLAIQGHAFQFYPNRQRPSISSKNTFANAIISRTSRSTIREYPHRTKLQGQSKHNYPANDSFSRRRFSNSTTLNYSTNDFYQHANHNQYRYPTNINTSPNPSYNSNDSYGKSRSNNNNHRKHKNRRWSSHSKHKKKKYQINKSVGEGKLKHAQQIESRLRVSLEQLRSSVASSSTAISISTATDATPNSNINNTQNLSASSLSPSLIIFPTTRECNTAMATFGDNNEFLRALRIFVKMRKSVYLAKKQQRLNSSSRDATTSHKQKKNLVFLQYPSPTLVTYSTLMSRAVQQGKPHVALRLWRLMTIQSNYFSKPPPSSSQTIQENPSSQPNLSDIHHANAAIMAGQPPIIPDVRAVNILMNAYAKLSDAESCQLILNQMLRQKDDNDDKQYNDDIKLSSTFSLDDPTASPYEDDPKIALMSSIPSSMKPNIVTWNTMIDACQRAGNLELALQTRKDMTSMGIRADIRTYTSLISAVARKQSGMYGARDPDMGFVLLEEMMENKLRPNGMTYCALIDVCKRCDRSDLALRVLRTMIKDNHPTKDSPKFSNSKPLENEVGAWTSAIDACGKAGRMDTAMRLFRSMLHSPNVNHVKPNMVTCASIMDSLFKADVLNMDNVLEILKYMKEEGLEPTEVMYTSLISSAGRLVKAENRLGSGSFDENDGDEEGSMTYSDNTSPAPKYLKRKATSAVDIYTELMGTLMKSDKKVVSNAKSNPEVQNTLLLKVFLVYQEMKATGAEADLALYNVLLKACASAGDFARAQTVMTNIYENNLLPNDATWREMLRAAANSNKVGLVEDLWQSLWKGDKSQKVILGNSLGAIDSLSLTDNSWTPSIEGFDSLLSGYLRQASLSTTDESTRRALYVSIVSMYKKLLDLKETKLQDDMWGLHHIDLEKLHSTQRTMMTILRAAVVVELMDTAQVQKSMKKGSNEKIFSSEREIAIKIVNLDCFKERTTSNSGTIGTKNKKVLELARIWSDR